MTDKDDKPQILRARVDWQGGLPRSVDYGDIYFSGEGLGETEHVFLAGNDLPSRWRELGRETFMIGECGFGGGLNFLCAWRLWEQSAPAGAVLHYLALEKHPLACADLARLHALWPELAPFSAALRAAYIDHTPGLHRLHLGGPERPVLLDLVYGDAAACLESLEAPPRPRVDAWFLDGFAPDRNPGMWSPRLFGALARFSRPGATIATYSVAGRVREGLDAAGFAVEKAPGHGRKRHMLIGRYAGPPAQPAPPEPWFVLPRAERMPGQALVIGAGMAGCATARALAERGLEVILLERRENAGTETSGNPQGALYLKLKRQLNPGARLLLHAWLYALRHYDRLRESGGADFSWRRCGLLQLAWSPREAEKIEHIVTNHLYAPEVLREVDAAQAAELAGLPLERGGLWLPGGGWLDPRALCQAYLAHPGITLLTGREARVLRRLDGGWRVEGAGSEVLAEGETVVIAAALDSLVFDACAHYPLRPVRGQLSRFPAGPRSAGLRAVLCGQGYVLPPQDGGLWVGATFGEGSRDTAVHEREHDMNLALAADIAPALRGEFGAGAALGGRAALRCVSPDHLPLVGPVEDAQESIRRYARLRHNARARLAEPPCHLPGLYLNAGHASQGLTTSPLAAEHLASLICGQLPPLPRREANAMHPARFLIRKLKRREL